MTMLKVSQEASSGTGCRPPNRTVTEQRDDEITALKVIANIMVERQVSRHTTADEVAEMLDGQMHSLMVTRYGEALADELNEGGKESTSADANEMLTRVRGGWSLHRLR